MTIKRTQKHDMRYIYQVMTHGIPYLVVKVPRVTNQGRKGYWKNRYFSLQDLGYNKALDLAKCYRQECIDINDSIPTARFFSISTHHIDVQWILRMRQLAQIYAEHDQIHLPTLAFIGIYGHSQLTNKDIAALVDVDTTAIRRQILALERRGFLKISHTAQITAGARKANFFTISDKGASLLTRFRNAVNDELPLSFLLNPKGRYVDLYVSLKQYNFYITINEVILLLFLEKGVHSSHQIAYLLQKNDSFSYTLFKNAAKKGLIRPAQSSQSHKAPLYEITETGQDILAKSRQI